MKYIFISLFVLAPSLFSYDELSACVQTEVSKTSVIFTCVHGEYYVEYTSSSKRDVKNLRVLFTKADKFKYLNKHKLKDILED